MQDPTVLLAILSRMAQKPTVKFDKLFQKLYNTDLWVLAYEQIAPKPGNMTPGPDKRTIDGMGLARIQAVIADLKASRYKPKPVRRTYIPKSTGGQRPLGIPCFEDKLLQTVVRLILEAIYEPTFSEASHGFRPNRSCHTALEQVKQMNGVRWWVECDIKGFFDNLHHKTLLQILSKRISDKRFLHLVEQFLTAGYVESWQYHKTYSGTPQGGPLSPILANIYLNELDQAVTEKRATFSQGRRRQPNPAYRRLVYLKGRAKQRARRTGDWSEYKALARQLHQLHAEDPQDPCFKRMKYVRYADDFLIGLIGSKADARAIKAWLAEYLKQELHLEVSPQKTQIINTRDTIRFLGYDIQRWTGRRIRKVRMSYGVMTKRTTTYHLALRIPCDKYIAFAKTYGNPQGWQACHRTRLHNLSELEILLMYNTEIRGFLGYYALADNLKHVASRLLWMTTSSFLRTLASKWRCSVQKVVRRLKVGANHFEISLTTQTGKVKRYALVSSTRQLEQKLVEYRDPDCIPQTGLYRSTTELGQRLRAEVCEWCGTRQGPFEVHHVRRLKDLHCKSLWERHMVERRRKTMILCRQCHSDLHAGRLRPRTTG